MKDSNSSEFGITVDELAGAFNSFQKDYKKELEKNIALGTKLDKNAVELTKQTKDLAEDISVLEKEITEHANSIEDLQTTQIKLNQKLQQLEKSVKDSEKATNQTILYRLSKVEEKCKSIKENDYDSIKAQHGFNTCFLLCMMTFLNIAAIFTSFFLPTLFAEGQVLLLWVPALIVINGAALFAWWGYLVDSDVPYTIWEVIVEGILILLNIVVLIQCAVSPIEEMVFARWMLFLFQVVANLLVIVIRIIYFSYEYGSSDLDTDDANIWIAIGITGCNLFILLFIFLI